MILYYGEFIIPVDSASMFLTPFKTKFENKPLYEKRMINMIKGMLLAF